MTIHERFRKLRKTLGYKEIDFGKFFSLSQDSISAIETGRNKPTIKILRKLREDFDVNIEWVLIGEGPLFRRDSLPAGEQNAWYIPYLRPVDQAGYGSEHFDAEKTGMTFPVAPYLLESYPREFTKALEITDDSMRDYLFRGDTVIFIENLRPNTDGIYVLNRGGSLIVKRITFKSNGNIVISSDNKNYHSEELAPPEQANLTILGKVILKIQKIG